MLLSWYLEAAAIDGRGERIVIWCFIDRGRNGGQLEPAVWVHLHSDHRVNVTLLHQLRLPRVINHGMELGRGSPGCNHLTLP